MNTLIKSIDQLLADKSLLKHPFYVLWSEGKLTRDMLAGYAKEYYQLVKVVPACVAKIAEHAPLSERGGLHANQVEEQEHIPLWSSFSKELGILPAELATYKGLPKTKEAVAKLQAICNGFAEGASAMYAFEKPLPDISTTKLEGIKSFYNMESKAATTYFEVHAVVDVVHAEHWASVLKKQDKTLEEALFACAEESVAAQHLLLDSCYEAYC